MAFLKGTIKREIKKSGNRGRPVPGFRGGGAFEKIKNLSTFSTINSVAEASGRSLCFQI